MKNYRSRYFLMQLALSVIILAVTFSACDNDEGSDDNSSVPDTGYEYIVINEVQSNDTDGFMESDFVELYNTSDQTYTFREGEWYITDTSGTMNGIMYIPGNTQIEGNGYLVLLPDEETVPGDAPSGSLANVIDGINLRFGLGSDDAIYLYYMGSSNPAPDAAIDSTAWSSHVRTKVRIPDGGAWAADDSRYPTPGAANETAGAITSFSFVTPAVAGVIDETVTPKTITVGVPASTDVTNLVAEFTYTGTAIQVGAVDQVSGVTSNNFTSAVTYTVTAYDSSTVDYTVTVLVAYSNGIIINEVQSTASGLANTLESDFVELYNSGASTYTFDEKEWYITDSDGASEHIFYIPDGTQIDPGAYLVLLPNVEALPLPDYAPLDSIICNGDNDSSFGLSSSDGVYLYYVGSLNANPTVPVDSTTWTSHVSTRSRVPDGGSWSSTDDRTPTPGVTNGS